MVYDSKDLHGIRSEVKPQALSWPCVLDDIVFHGDIWTNVEKAAQFWKLHDRSRVIFRSRLH